jgi:ubiquinone biosynthesis protein UbiJ
MTDETDIKILARKSEQLVADVAAMRDDMARLIATVGRIDITFRAEMSTIRARVDGIPITNRSLTVVQQEIRSLKAAFNDFARTNVTVGEIEVLHEDVNRVQAENAELSTRIVTLERLIEELRKS